MNDVSTGGSTWWLAGEPFTRPVTVEWTRSEYDSETGERIDAFSGLAVGGQWKQAGDVHYLSYVETAGNAGGEDTSHGARQGVEGGVGLLPEASAKASTEQTRTTLKLERECLTIVRFGYMQGSQVFQPGVTTSTVLNAGPVRLTVETCTTVVRTQVHPNGGQCHVEAAVEVAGHLEKMALTMQWSAGTV